MAEQWTYEPCGDVDGDRVGVDHFVLDAAGDEVANPGSEARARLIAASPDLLAALTAVRAWCIPGMDWTDDLARQLLAEADAAIAKAKAKAKAKGGSP